MVVGLGYVARGDQCLLEEAITYGSEFKQMDTRNEELVRKLKKNNWLQRWEYKAVTLSPTSYYTT